MSDNCLVCGGNPEWHHNNHSERTGFYVGQAVRWDIPDDDPVYGVDATAGANIDRRGVGEVDMPNDGGFVWLKYEGARPIVPAKFVVPIAPPNPVQVQEKGA